MSVDRNNFCCFGFFVGMFGRQCRINRVHEIGWLDNVEVTESMK